MKKNNYAAKFSVFVNGKHIATIYSENVNNIFCLYAVNHIEKTEIFKTYKSESARTQGITKLVNKYDKKYLEK